MSSISNLLHFLSPNSRLPPDVTFQVLSSTTSSPVSVPAHKCFLAASSQVFDKLFFQSDNAREQREVIKVENVEEEVFRKFLDHIYGKEFVLEELSDVSSMLQMFQLVERYDMVEIKEKLLTRIKSQTVKKENFLTIVNLMGQCEEHSMAKEILEAMISRYLERNLGPLGKLSSFMSEHGLDTEVFVSILGIVDKLQGEGDVCKEEAVEKIPPVSSDIQRKIVTEFLNFSKFPGDKMEEMVDMFIQSGFEKLGIRGVGDQ